MKPFFNALGNAKLAITVILTVAVLSIFINLYQFHKASNYPTHLDVWLHNCDGTINKVDPNEMSKVRLLNFASQEWVKLNTWTTDGATDSKRLLEEERDYVSPTFANQYKQLISNLDSRNWLNNYVVVTTPLSNDAENNVQAYNGGWLVTQKFISRFYYNPNNQVKDDLASNARFENELEQTITFFISKYPNTQGLGLESIVKTDFVENTLGKKGKTNA